jgi:hypothetical protein
MFPDMYVVSRHCVGEGLLRVPKFPPALSMNCEIRRAELFMALLRILAAPKPDGIHHASVLVQELGIGFHVGDRI